MPISEKIIKEIDEIDVEDRFKALMTEILKLEDDGVKRWTKQYDSMINSYLGIEEENDN